MLTLRRTAKSRQSVSFAQSRKSVRFSLTHYIELKEAYVSDQIVWLRMRV